MNPRTITVASHVAAFALASFLSASSASACNVVGYTKSGERRCATTYVYKKSKRWDDPSQYTNKAEKCRSACLRDAIKLSSGNAQSTFFIMCKRKNGCS